MEIDKNNLVNYIMDFEAGKLDRQNIFKLFAYLIKTGQVWSLQGYYGRTARTMIDMGYIDKNGNILKDDDNLW